MKSALDDHSNDFAVRVSCWLIGLYQRYAPARIRNSCRFEPTCSDYALICLRHYGFWRGWRESFSRIRRCCPPHGGMDHPLQEEAHRQPTLWALRKSERGGCSEGFSEGCGAGLGFKAADSGSGCFWWVAIIGGLMFIGLLQTCGIIK